MQFTDNDSPILSQLKYAIFCAEKNSPSSSLNIQVPEYLEANISQINYEPVSDTINIRFDVSSASSYEHYTKELEEKIEELEEKINQLELEISRLKRR